MDHDLVTALPDVVKVEPWLGNRTDGYPGAQYGPVRAYPAYIQWMSKMVRDATGSTVVSSATTIVDTGRQVVNGVVSSLATQDVLTAKDRITLTDKSQPTILRVDRLSDDKGPYATVIYT